MIYQDCIVCDSLKVQLKENQSSGISKKGNFYNFVKLYYLCNNCKFEFVTYDLSIENNKRLKESIRRYHEYRKLD